VSALARAPGQRPADPAGMPIEVSEIFGPTLQGEGVSVGRAAAFLRLARCGVGCAWCDTRYSWDFEPEDAAQHAESVTAQACWEQVRGHLPPGRERLLVVSGGEPLLQAQALAHVLRLAKGAGCRVEVETSGVVPPGALVPFVDLFTVSPKLRHSAVSDARRMRPAVLAELADTGRAVFKFVVRGPQDLDEVAELAEPYPAVPVMVMPLGTSPHRLGRVLRALAEPVAARGWRLTPRMHIDLWGNERGR